MAQRTLSQTIQDSSDLMERVRREGVTDASGRVLRPPESQAIRQINRTGDEPLATFQQSQETANQVAQTPYQKFNLILMDMLRKYQQLGTGKFKEAELAGRESRIGALRETPESLIGAPPSLQRSVREAEAGVFEPEITGAKQMRQTFSERIQSQISGIKDILTQSRIAEEEFKKEETAKRKEKIDFLMKFPSIAKNLPKDQQTQLAKEVGISVDFLNAMPEEQEKWTETTLSDGSLAQQNSRTGEIKILIKGSEMGGVGAGTEKETIRGMIMDLPAGQQDGAFGAIASFKNAKDIEDLLNQGVSTGPVSGRFQKLKQKTQGGASQTFNQFVAATTAFTANYIKALSGVQVSDRERQFLMKALPSPENQEQVNKDNLKMLLEFLKNKYELQLGLNFAEFPNEIPQIGEDEWEYTPDQ